jgi:hypothetical protein
MLVDVDFFPDGSPNFGHDTHARRATTSFFIVRRPRLTKMCLFEKQEVVEHVSVHFCEEESWVPSRPHLRFVSGESSVSP